MLKCLILIAKGGLIWQAQLCLLKVCFYNEMAELVSPTLIFFSAINNLMKLPAPF